MSEILKECLDDWIKQKTRGITSVCSSHPWVLKTALSNETPLIIESTCNQVNQFGGYTGMNPHQFFGFINNLARENGKSSKDFILGGDHLGPSPWQAEPQKIAMENAKELIRSYVKAGYEKIHLDASMPLLDDHSRYVDVEIAAERAAKLAQIAENNKEKTLYYVIGTEVPTPGGALTHEDDLKVTPLKDAQETLTATKEAFFKHGLERAWENVIAVVVQPGVEFGNDFIHDYDTIKAEHLSNYILKNPLVFEAHSTDYQTRQNLRRMVEDGFEILKVGPALTYAYREAVFILSWIEKELFPEESRSNLLETIDFVMRKNPDDWKQHYHGEDFELDFARKFSFSDRIRYYWFYPEVKEVLEILARNFSTKEIPLSLLSQYTPLFYNKVRNGITENSMNALIKHRINKVINDYNYACNVIVGED